MIWCPLLIPFLIGFVRIAIDACTLGLAGAHLQHGVDAAGPAAANLLWQGGTDELEIRQAAVDMGAANKGLVDPLLPAPNPSNAAFAWPRTIWRNSPPCQRQLHRRPATALSAVVAICAYCEKKRSVARRLMVSDDDRDGRKQGGASGRLRFRGPHAAVCPL